MRERIRPYRAEDAAAVRGVHLRAFDGREDEARLVGLLHAAGAAPVSLVAEAESGGRVVGHVLFSPARIDGHGPKPLVAGLAPVGVLPEYQGRGIGSRLIREGLEACRRAGYDAAVVVGEPGYYSRFGFERAGGVWATSTVWTSTSWSRISGTGRSTACTGRSVIGKSSAR